MGLIEKLYLNLLSYSLLGWAAAIGGALVVITLFLSMFLLLIQHLSSYKNPEIVNDLKFTVTHAVEPMEKGFTRFNWKLHKFSENIRKHEKEKLKTKDDSSIGSSLLAKRVRGINDPLLNGSVSSSVAKRGRRRVKNSGYKVQKVGEKAVALVMVGLRCMEAGGSLRTED